MAENTSGLDKGVFILSLDFELIWGTLDLFGPDRFRKACELERELIIERLLALLEEFELPATWCVLGHLFLDQCSPKNGRKHPEILRPAHSWVDRDWFECDPGGTEESAPIFLGRSLVEKIRGCRVPQEIGSHSFSHIIFGDPGCSREVAESDIAACVRLAREIGIELRSFAFPRNAVGHLDVLKKYGFVCYRGPEPHWYDRRDLPSLPRRLAHLFDVLTAARPPVVLPEEHGDGLWNIPGSMIYFPMHGLRRYIPLFLRVRRALKGLDAAARGRRIFHLWFHPTNLADETDRLFNGLRTIFIHASELRAAGALRFATMSSVVASAPERQIE